MRYPFSYKRLLLSLLFLVPVLSYAQQWQLVEEIKYDREINWPWGFTNRYLISDSSVYKYAAGNTTASSINADTVHYDTVYNYRVHVYNMEQPYYRVARTYDDNNVLETYVTSEFDSATGQWHVTNADSFTINNGRATRLAYYKVDKNSTQKSLFNNAAIDYVYNASGDMIQEERSLYGTATQPPIAASRSYRKYHNGLLIIDSISSKSSGLWTPAKMVTYTYNSNGKRTSTEGFIINQQNALTLDSKHYYIYNAKGQLLSDSLYNFSSSSYHVHKYSYNANGQKHADTFRTSTWQEYPLTVYDYTPFGYLSQETVFFYDSAAASYVHFKKHAYKYKAYWPVDVKEVATTTNDITLYPNPATNVLHIDSKAGFDKGYIYNTQGQLVKEVQGNAKQVDISQLSVGNYFLQLRTNDKTRSRQFVIVR